MKHPLGCTTFLGLALLSLSNIHGQAQAIVPVFQNETNQPGFTTQDYQFTGLSAENYPAYPQLTGPSGGVGAWPAPIAANGGNLTASLNRPDPTQTTDFLSASAFGGGIYSFFSETTFAISQTAPLGGLSSLTFQLYLAAGSDANATNNEYIGLPKLTLNLANSQQVVVTAGPGTALNSTSAVIFGQSTELDDVDFTFNTAGLTSPVTSYTLDWTTATHSITYGVDITEAEAVAVPEPSTWGLLALAGLGGVIYRVRRARSHLS